MPEQTAMNCRPVQAPATWVAPTSKGVRPPAGEGGRRSRRSAVAQQLPRSALAAPSRAAALRPASQRPTTATQQVACGGNRLWARVSLRQRRRPAWLAGRMRPPMVEPLASWVGASAWVTRFAFAAGRWAGVAFHRACSLELVRWPFRLLSKTNQPAMLAALFFEAEPRGLRHFGAGAGDADCGIPAPCSAACEGERALLGNRVARSEGFFLPAMANGL